MKYGERVFKNELDTLRTTDLCHEDLEWDLIGQGIGHKRPREAPNFHF